MTTVGLLTNPIAGMGGAVGLKGTDGQAAEALRRGAVPRASSRAAEALRLLAGRGIRFLTPAGAMGADALDAAGITGYEVVFTPGEPTTAADTREACRAFAAARVDLILFCGGDGTARDVLDAVGRSVPVLGIPAGVKMYSAVFAVNPAAAAAVVIGLDAARLRDADVLDVDEEAYREGRLAVRFYGAARVPYLPGRVQGAKAVFEEVDDERAKREIARFIAEVMNPEILYIVGAGSTTEAILAQIGLEGTLLGVDLVMNGRVVAKDADERTILSHLTGAAAARIIASPIGAQGFILGRGNQQISPAVVRRAGGPGRIIVVGTPAKLAGTPALYVDSGDPALDGEFGDSIAVVSGYRIAQRKRVAHHR
ncbi:MAG: ATP-NAD kinase family protein [Methanoculleus bourgensis]|jgi:predicted polyphosphate/ATP-dependent NAD kinase|uniref:ATP-NAD/AcoX kinase n=1 Tax=Methanoculleus bourgensis (strain ATCC 43281 / DSM 3045 / OCM 15 / MS2) TaxID=1201294 RepID=I7KD20_METBM|nr:ATP-NAD kinase family protein [Methanoculleus bourgensis]NMA88266.1 ATP-NAD kinase family protein [Methanoculleus bourgensis]CCJ36436.1 ATP-NAD/AcoX kinase [Methanoculleus bourgensis MS2]